jgi:hypothetical protein
MDFYKKDLQLMLSKSLLSTLTICSIPVAAADCNIPDKLTNDILIEDIATFVSGSRNYLTAKYLLKEGYESYIEFTYSSDSYSKAIESMIKERNRIGYAYEPLIKNQPSMLMDIAKKALTNKIESCGAEPVRPHLIKALQSILEGKNLEIEYNLRPINKKTVAQTF